MSHSQNIHPNRRWETVTVRVYEPERGACIMIKLEDAAHQYYDIALHYGENANEFVSKLKEAVAVLPCQNEVNPNAANPDREKEDW